MKKFLALLLSLSMVLALSACGTGKPIGDLLKGNTGVSGQQETENPGGNAGEFDFGAILSGNGGSELYSGYSAEQKAALVEAAKADGMDVEFGADGSTTFKDKDGSEVVQKADGTWTVKDPDGGEGQLGGSWPDNEFTKLVPKPDFALGAAAGDSQEFSVVFMNATIKQMRGYTDKVKAAGFTVGAEVEDQELMGMVVYTYSASNAAGYQIEIYSAAGISGLTIRK